MSDSTSSLHRVLTALALLREATPAEIATQAGLGYSTVPPKLRRLEADELAIQSPDSGTGKTVRKWTLTPKGILAAAVTPDTGATDTEQMPAEQHTDAENDENTANALDADSQDDHHEATDPRLPVVTSTIDAIAASDEDTPTDHRDSATHAEPAPAFPESDIAHQAEDADQQPEPASPDQARTSVDVNAPEQRPEDASGTAPAESGSAEPAELTAAVTAVDPRSPEPATPPPSAPQHDADAGTGTAEKDDDLGEAQDGEPAAARQVTRPRRRSGNLRAAVLKVLQSNPGQRFTVREVCKAIDAANTDSDAAKASAGAVNNALLKLTNDGLIQQVGDKPALYQAV